MATDEQIATAFNAGYIMQQADPGMMDKLLLTDNKDNQIIQAMAAGRQQAEREKIAKQQQAIKERSQAKTKRH